MKLMKQSKTKNTFFKRTRTHVWNSIGDYRAESRPRRTQIRLCQWCWGFWRKNKLHDKQFWSLICIDRLEHSLLRTVGMFLGRFSIWWGCLLPRQASNLRIKPPWSTARHGRFSIGEGTSGSLWHGMLPEL